MNGPRYFFQDVPMALTYLQVCALAVRWRLLPFLAGPLGHQLPSSGGAPAVCMLHAAQCMLRAICRILRSASMLLV